MDIECSNKNLWALTSECFIILGVHNIFFTVFQII